MLQKPKLMVLSELIKQALIELELILYRGFTIKEAHKWIGTPYRNITNRFLKRYFIQKKDMFNFKSEGFFKK